MSIDRDSTRNQDIKRKFVSHNVLANVTDWAGQLFVDSDFEDWDNIYGPVCPECESIHSMEIVPHVDGFEPEDVNPITHPYRCLWCDYRLEELPDEEQVEIFEFWIVTPWLGEKLKAHREAVMARPTGWVWGRQGTGQAILLDSVISDICEELGILETQEDKEVRS